MSARATMLMNATDEQLEFWAVLDADAKRELDARRENNAIGCYERHCNEYALHGDPMRDHCDYELAADYDRWDGHRMDMIGIDCDSDDCSSVSSDDAWTAVLWDEGQMERRFIDAWNDLGDPSPF